MNPHHANIGDVVKHLMLAQLLHLQPPKRFVESHAGAADYPLVGKVGRTHDAIQMMADIGDNEDLQNSAFVRLLFDSAGHKRYPGSPSVAMHILGNTCEYVFHDLVQASLDSIKQTAHVLSIENVHIKKSDGLVGALEHDKPEDFVFLDPFKVNDRLEGPNTLEVFDALSQTPAQVLLWYPLLNEHDEPAMAQALEAEHRRVSFWLDEPKAGLAGCGMAMSGINERVWENGLQLLASLARIWDADLVST
jgi:23S rRNA (adenine2030-N6)-methyltransferase